MQKLTAFGFAILLAAACHSGKKSTSSSRPKPKSKPKIEAPAAAATFTIGGVIFQNSERLSPVLEKAQKEKRPVFVELHAKWCAPCKVLEEDVFTQKPTFSYLNAHFLNFRADFDAENGQTIASIYEVKTLPTILFLDPKGVVLERKTGGLTFSEIKRMGDSALAKMK